MVARRAISAAGCTHCRLAVLKLFVASSTPTPFIRARSSASWHPTLASRTSRAFSSAPKPIDVNEAKDAAHDSQLQLEDQLLTPDSQDVVEQPPQSNDGDTPWYLQVEPPRHTAATEPPPLPDIPPNSPALLDPLVKYASEEMGLDELTLLDLRELNPPPALGANLFMLFGTARSERHLNVSAGRLVRWLRVQHRVYADADGLLGPNERKTKLRRKAKKAKLLGTMGTDDADDGITTGWICVNLGSIDRGGEQAAVVSDDGRVAGFGVSQKGYTVVFQIMTESRRAELGLETLWQRTLLRQLNKSDPAEHSEMSVESEVHPLEQAIHSKAPSHQSIDPRDNNGCPGQSRSFSTSTRLASSAYMQNIFRDDKLLDPLLLDPVALSQTLLYDGHAKLRLTKILRVYLENLPAREALRTLKSEVFQKLSSLATRNLLAEHTWAFRLASEAVKARQFATMDLSDGHLLLGNTRQLISEMRIHGISPSRQQYLQLISCIYSPLGPPLNEQTNLALELLESLHLRGEPIIANDIVVTIIEAISRCNKPREEAEDLQQRLEELMVQVKLPCMDEPLLVRLMDAYARQENWGKFWETWRIPARFLRPRSAAMYIHIYRLMAATKSRSLCIDALRRCFQEMVIENPPVRPIGNVRDAMLDCIRVADPRAEEDAERIPANAVGPMQRVANREFVKLVRTIKSLG